MRPSPRDRVLLSWSSGKDSAWALHRLRQRDDIEIVGLLTTFNESADRVAMHAVRHALVRQQAEAANLPLWPVMLPWPCTNEDYESRMQEAVDRARAEGVTQVAFGDLFLEDIRAYREQRLEGTGLSPVFPLWGLDTAALSREMIGAGLQAVLTCVDPKQVPADLVGRPYDQALIEALPPGADPCGERGEFHTFCHAGPMFSKPVPVRLGEVLDRDGFCYADLMPG